MSNARNLADLLGTDTQIQTADIADDAVTAGKLNDNATQLFGMRNFIINGGMDVWQRGTSFASATATAGGFYSDRFWLYGLDPGSGTFERSTDVPSGQGFAYSFFNNTSGTFAFGTNVELSIQGSAAPFVFGGSYTLSFWIKAGASGTGTVAAQYENAHADGTNRVAIDDTTFSFTTSWQKISWTFTIGENPHANNRVLGIEFSSLDAGFKITGIQLEAGSVATPFERKPIGLEEALCKRYCEAMYSGEMPEQGTYYASWRYTPVVRFSVEKRATPTITVTSQGGWPLGSGGTYGINPDKEFVQFTGQSGNALNNQLHTYGFIATSEL